MSGLRRSSCKSERMKVTEERHAFAFSVFRKALSKEGEASDNKKNFMQRFFLHLSVETM